jgi:hypothetical protein
MYVYKDGMTLEEQKNGAYWERNMLALMLAKFMEASTHTLGYGSEPCGYYIHGEWEGWSRVISINNGKITFHVPDDFDIGDLQQIEPNWDGHTTEEKWKYVMDLCGVTHE